MQDTMSENLSIGVIRIVIGVAIAGGIAKRIVVRATAAPENVTLPD